MQTSDEATGMNIQDDKVYCKDGKSIEALNHQVVDLIQAGNAWLKSQGDKMLRLYDLLAHDKNRG